MDSIQNLNKQMNNLSTSNYKLEQEIKEKLKISPQKQTFQTLLLKLHELDKIILINEQKTNQIQKHFQQKNKYLISEKNDLEKELQKITAINKQQSLKITEQNQEINSLKLQIRNLDKKINHMEIEIKYMKKDLNEKTSIAKNEENSSIGFESFLKEEENEGIKKSDFKLLNIQQNKYSSEYNLEETSPLQKKIDLLKSTYNISDEHELMTSQIFQNYKARKSTHLSVDNLEQTVIQPRQKKSAHYLKDMQNLGII